ncbi:WD40-repeat-containing domain protein [Protomyces lactucae-debilis]|uniref:WD40-repeat-containing domain protein n=1 Tax=Protomyces lactucae-debilis TaxID=2754530 RepID=A0A1Y2F5T1_PROLT|nr:WD40-repeat-containing domain protein [Protomyces lactucae-debilis]ORY79017.1 WD40-repeat-containing domain protein [Protomyces lactucae-debilis]
MALNFLVSNERDGHIGDIFAVSAAPDGAVLYSAGADGALRQWNAESQELLSTHDAAEDPLWRVALSPDAQTLACSTASGTLRVYGLASPMTTPTLDATLPTRSQFGMCIAYSPDGGSICTGHKGGDIYLFDTVAGKLRHTLAGQSATVRAVAFSPGSSLIAAAGDGPCITIHDTRSGEQRKSLLYTSAQRQSAITSLAWNQTGELLLTASTDGKVKVWHVERGECLCTLTESTGPVFTACWAKRGKLEGFVVGGAESKLRFYLPTTAT